MRFFAYSFVGLSLVSQSLTLSVNCDTIVDIASKTDSLSTLVAALKAADLVDLLASDGPFTVFAPSNDAFDALPPGLLDELLKPENKQVLTMLLEYHVVAGTVAHAADLTDGEKITTAEGEDVTVTINDDGVFINGNAQVIQADVDASNGVVHVVNNVILPPSLNVEEMLSGGNTIVDIATATDSLSTLVAALKAADLVDLLASDGPFTVFAPSNDAFDALPAGLLDELLKPENKQVLTMLLEYHVVAGTVAHAADLTDGEKITTAEGEDVTVTINDDGVFINGNAQVIQADVDASNGVVHVVNNVILPPMLDEMLTRKKKSQNIVELASATKDLSTLVAAVKAADLVDLLSSDGSFTVFAPTNEAFSALPDGVLDNLLKPENKDALTNLLEYHVVAGTVAHAADLSDGEEIETAFCENKKCRKVRVHIKDKKVFINRSQVTTADVDASNGVVHIIDAVLVPMRLLEDLDISVDDAIFYI